MGWTFVATNPMRRKISPGMATEMLLNAINFLCSEVHLMYTNGDIISNLQIATVLNHLCNRRRYELECWPMWAMHQGSQFPAARTSERI